MKKPEVVTHWLIFDASTVFYPLGPVPPKVCLCFLTQVLLIIRTPWWVSLQFLSGQIPFCHLLIFLSLTSPVQPAYLPQKTQSSADVSAGICLFLSCFFYALILSHAVKQSFPLAWTLSNRSTNAFLFVQVSVTLCSPNLWAHAICLSSVPEDQLAEISFLASSGAKMTSIENSWCCFPSRHWESIRRGSLTPTLINNNTVI